MKKIVVFLLTAAMLVSVFAVASVAANFSMTVDGVNTVVETGQTVICTSLNDWANCNPNWSMNAQCTPDGDGYKVIAVVSCPAEIISSAEVTAPALIAASDFTNASDDIYVISHYDGNANAGKISVGQHVTVSKMEAGATISFSGDIVSAPDANERYDTKGNVALNKSYTGKGYTDTQWNSDYTAKLTDGKALNSLTYDNNWFGINHNPEHEDTDNTDENGVISIVIDLENTCDISSVKVNTYVGGESGIKAPESMVAYVSDSATKGFKKIGTLKAGTANENDVAWYEVAKSAQGRYVKLEVAVASDAHFAFINEVAVYGRAVVVEPDPDPVVPDPDPTLTIDVGEPNADPAFTADITAPETYVAGEEFTVTVTINNVKYGLQAVEAHLYYDTTKIALTNPPKEGAAQFKCFNVFNDRWEDMTRVKYNDDGSIKYIQLNAITAGEDEGPLTVSESGVLSFTISFTAKADATGGVTVAVPHNTVTGSNVDDKASYVGNGGSVVIAQGAAVQDPSESDPSDDNSEVSDPATEDQATNDTPTPVVPGDATSMVFFAIIALVAIAASAVVIKTRK